jgi:hypothetical protein
MEVDADFLFRFEVGIAIKIVEKGKEAIDLLLGFPSELRHRGEVSLIPMQSDVPLTLSSERHARRICGICRVSL